MRDPIGQRDLEARMDYCDKALRCLLELVQGTASLVNAIGLPEVVEHLGRAALEIEDAWAALLQEHASSIIATKEQGQPRNTEGHME